MKSDKSLKTKLHTHTLTHLHTDSPCEGSMNDDYVSKQATNTSTPHKTNILKNVKLISLSREDKSPENVKNFGKL